MKFVFKGRSLAERSPYYSNVNFSCMFDDTFIVHHPFLPHNYTQSYTFRFELHTLFLYDFLNRAAAIIIFY